MNFVFIYAFTLAVSCAFMNLLVAVQTEASNDPLAYMAPPILCQQPKAQVFVGRIAVSQDKPATFGHPPQVRVLVEQVLQGTLQPNQLVSATWLPEPKAESHMRLSDLGWSLTPMRGPRKGERFILLITEQRKSVLQVGPWGRFGLTPERLTRIKKMLNTPERDLCGPKADR